MTLEELSAREAIRERIAAYNQAGDRGRLEALAACFAPDGVLELPNGTWLEGRAAIVAELQAVARELAARTQRPLLRHHVSSVTIELTGPDTATARAYFAVYTEAGLDHWGGYADRLVRHEGAWLFAERRTRLDGAAPDSRMVRDSDD